MKILLIMVNTRKIVRSVYVITNYYERNETKKMRELI